MAANIVLALVLLANGLAAGVLVGTELGGFPLMRALPADQYVATHAFFSTRYDPFMPACLLGTVLGDLVTVPLAERAVQAVLFGFAAVAALSTIVISLTKNVPLNKWVQDADPQRLPADWQRRRSDWGLWNRRRTLLVSIAFVANCLAIALA